MCSSPPTKSELITKWADPGQISAEKDYIMCFAGRSRGNNGNAGSGMVLYDTEGSELWCGHQSLGEITSNEAIYETLVTALQCALTLGVQRITAQGSSELVHRQMDGTYRVKKPSLKEYHGKAMSLSREFASFRIERAESSLNKRAVELAKKAIAMQSINTLEHNHAMASRDEDESNIEKTSPSPSPNADVSLDLGSISPERTYVLRFDGGSRGNPGTAGSGMVLYDGEDGSELWSGYQYLGDKKTNNEAEYMALITGLRCARSLGVENIVVQGDSQLILRQIEGKYKVKSLSLKDYYKEALSLSREFASFHTSHIERARNARADELANIAMDTKSSVVSLNKKAVELAKKAIAMQSINTLEHNHAMASRDEDESNIEKTSPSPSPSSDASLDLGSISPE
eukprot:CAMPEP_0172576600 /NCGR_PEP_ID=MMETSP1067-20121228/137807_1 /TAXON_ID=265564 ORGANISM="Thalassiosira punctigera, Strain Tpunct2005C2" /NCGR_SAMPLE_ID=MMETSP1067 /ASSEMBLY_ACC=CAM_ASM_000444 /LENGTH=399 /DNA_ID=CAMNT_0013369275 /DNA_START=290 /DNA_END=1486 /DNA_ORIENTATION=-